MLEVNLGNKTMVFGLVIALILSYGMVNFNSVQKAEIAFPKASAAVRIPAPVAVAPDAMSAARESDGLEEAGEYYPPSSRRH